MKILLFVGAGVSIPSGLPSAAALTNELFKPRTSDDAQTTRLRALLRLIADYDSADIKRVGPYRTREGFAFSGAIYRGSASTYEDIYFLCEEMSLWNIGLSDNCLTTPFMDCIERSAGDLLDGSSPVERLWNLGRLARPACDLIAAIVADTLRRPYLTGFELISDLATSADIEELNIVTLNHDTLVEAFLTDLGIDYSDGFGPKDGDVRWSDDRSYENYRRVRIFKLHGSVNWYGFQRRGTSQNAVFLGRDISEAKDGSGQPLSLEYRAASFLSGLNKSVSYDRGIYADVHFRFAELLRCCDRIVMSGYGWGDTAINHQLAAWFDRAFANRMILLHEESKSLMNGSMIMASGYNGWVDRGQLIPIERWLCDTRLRDVRAILID